MFVQLIGINGCCHDDQVKIYLQIGRRVCAKIDTSGVGTLVEGQRIFRVHVVSSIQLAAANQQNVNI